MPGRSPCAASRALKIDGNIDPDGRYISKVFISDFDRIKVDRSFVLDIEADTNANAISACIVTLAKAMNLEVVAEGVETNGQLEYLLRQGCDLIQGYLFGRPMTPEVLNTWFHEEGGEAQR